MAPELEFSGCIYNNDPDDEYYKLSPDDLKNMKLVGLPIRVEHHDTDSGEVLDSWVSDDGKAYVKWRFSDSPRGWGLAKLVRDGKVCELSLKHAEFCDGTKEALEVSVVEKGARPQTFIHKGAPVKYICASIRFKETAMEGQASRYYERNPDGTFAPVPEASVTVAAPTQAVAASDAAPPTAPPGKRPVDASLDSRRSKVAKLAQLAEQILPHLQDAELSSTFVSSISDMVNNHEETEKILDARGRELASLQELTDKSKSRDRDLAKEIVDGIVSLWGDLTIPVDEEKKRVMMQAYESNPELAQASQQWVVAASKVGAMKQAMAGVEQKTQLQILQEQLKRAQQQISAIGNMQGSPPPSAPAPSWVPVVAAPPQQQQVVAASGKEAASGGFVMPDILNNLPAYNGLIGKVKQSDIYTSRG